MKKRIVFSGLAWVSSLWCWGCAPANPDTNENTGGNTNDNGTGNVEVIFPVNYAETYVEVRDCRVTIEHAASNIASVRVVASPESVDAYNAFDTIPEGGVVVKEEFSDPLCQNLTQYRVMKKEEAGFDATIGDWRCQKVTAARQILENGPETCIACHTRTECLARDFMCECPCPGDPG